MADQIALRQSESNISAGSAHTITAEFRTRSTAAASTPSSIRYRVDCLTNGQNVINWTSVSAASSATIDVGGTYNAIIDESNDTEKRQLTVEIDTGLSTQVRQAIPWTVRNIRTYVPTASFQDDLLLEPYYPITAAEISAGVTPTHYGYEDIELLRYGADRAVRTTPASYSDSALDSAVDTSEIDANRPVHFKGGNYKFQTNILLHQGTGLIGEGTQGSGNDNRLIHVGTGDFLTWDGNGDANEGTGGCIKNFQVVKASGASGGDAVTLIATDDNHRPGEFQLDNILILGDGTENWDRGLVIDGDACTTPGSIGVRSVNGNKVRVADCATALKYVYLTNATHCTFNHLQIDQGTGGTPGMTIEGDSENINIVNAVINGEIEINENATQVNIHGKVSTLDVNNASCIGSFVGSASTITCASPNFAIVSNARTMFRAELTSDATNVSGDGTDWILQGLTEQYDQGGNLDPTTGIFTCTQAGVHHFVAFVTVFGLGAGHDRFDLKVIRRNSGGTIQDSAVELFDPTDVDASSGHVTARVPCSFNLTEGDTVEVVVDISGGALAADVLGNGQSTYFEGFRL